MADESRPSGFVPLKTVAGARPDAASALAEIRQIYFKTSRRTIDNDFAHAVALLKSLPDEDTRAKAHVYMEGLAAMAREWAGRERRGKVKKLKGEKVPGKRKGTEKP
jgi:hypothetical protein